MDYWEMRAARRLEQNEEGAKESLRVLGKAFARAQKDILADMERLERSMGNKYGLTPMEVRALLDKPCGREEYLRLLERIEQLPRGDERNALMAQAAAPSYAFRRSRLEALRDQTRARTALLASEYEQQVTGQLDKTIREAYARAGFDAQARIGFAAPFAAMNEGAVRRILQAPWSGMHFSKRIWQNQEALTELLNETITSGFMTGRSVKGMIAEVQEKMGVAYRAAERLVRTETAAMASMADKEAYKSAGIKRYRYLATLDSLTSKICMALDGEVFDVDDMVIGKNCPPMHPNCRSTTTAVVEGVDLSEAQRRSKDPATGMPVRVPRTMSYKEWAAVQGKVYKAEETPAPAVQQTEPEFSAFAFMPSPTVKTIRTVAEIGAKKNKLILKSSRLKSARKVSKRKREDSLTEAVLLDKSRQDVIMLLNGLVQKRFEQEMGILKVEEPGIDGFRHRPDGRILVTHYREFRHSSPPSKMPPFSVVEYPTGKRYRQIDRTYYGEDGRFLKQVHGGTHGVPNTTYDNDGVHVHDFINGIRKHYADEKHGRDLNDKEKEENYDIIDHRQSSQHP